MKRVTAAYALLRYATLPPPPRLEGLRHYSHYAGDTIATGGAAARQRRCCGYVAGHYYGYDIATPAPLIHTALRRLRYALALLPCHYDITPLLLRH